MVGCRNPLASLDNDVTSMKNVDICTRVRILYYVTETLLDVEGIVDNLPDNDLHAMRPFWLSCSEKTGEIYWLYVNQMRIYVERRRAVAGARYRCVDGVEDTTDDETETSESSDGDDDAADGEGAEADDVGR